MHSAVKPGGASYCAIGDLWKGKRETDKEFQGFKAMELENAAKTEQEHADDIKKLVCLVSEMFCRCLNICMHTPVDFWYLGVKLSLVVCSRMKKQVF